MLGTARKTRTRSETITVPAHDQLRALIKRTRLSNASDIRVENFFVFFFLFNVFGLIAIFAYGFAHFAVAITALHAPNFASQVSISATVIAAVFILTTIEHHRPGYLCRILWQCTLPCLGWPRRFRRTHVYETFEVPFNLTLNDERTHISWTVQEDNQTLIQTRRAASSDEDDEDTLYTSHTWQNGSLDLARPLACVEWTRDPDEPHRTCLRLQDHTGRRLDLILDAPTLIPTQTRALLPALKREGIQLSHHDQHALWEPLVEALRSSNPSARSVRLMTTQGLWEETQRRTRNAKAFAR